MKEEEFEMTVDKWVHHYNLVKREFWCILGIIFIFIISCIVCCNSCNTAKTNESFFDEAVFEYENNTGIKIYPYGRDCLRKAAANCKTKEEVYKVIVENEKWFR